MTVLVGRPDGVVARKGDRVMARKFFLFLMILSVSVVLVSEPSRLQLRGSDTEGGGIVMLRRSGVSPSFRTA
jgi:hypothetical protein